MGASQSVAQLFGEKEYAPLTGQFALQVHLDFCFSHCITYTSLGKSIHYHWNYVLAVGLVCSSLKAISIDKISSGGRLNIYYVLAELRRAKQGDHEGPTGNSFLYNFSRRERVFI